jgi:hypothetical protein
MINKYNSDPVEYCKHCLSLAVVEESEYVYCNNCGRDDILERPLSIWERAFAAKYGQPYLNMDNNFFKAVSEDE